MQSTATDRHKPGHMVRLPRPLAERLDIIVQRNLSDRTAEVQRIVREYLEREGLWPPKQRETE